MEHSIYQEYTFISDVDKVIQDSKLSVLSLSGCQLCDQHVDDLQKIVSPGSLSSLNDLNLSKNPGLTLKSISAFINLTTGIFNNVTYYFILVH